MKNSFKAYFICFIGALFYCVCGAIFNQAVQDIMLLSRPRKRTQASHGRVPRHSFLRSNEYFGYTSHLLIKSVAVVYLQNALVCMPFSPSMEKRSQGYVPTRKHRAGERAGLTVQAYAGFPRPKRAGYPDFRELVENSRKTRPAIRKQRPQ